jgi:protein-disulfide isomerase
MVAPANRNSEQQGKKDRREAARETARLEREAEKRRQRRNRLFLQGGVGLAVIAIVAVGALFVVNATKGAGPGPLNMASDGILLKGDKMDALPTKAVKDGAKPVATQTTASKGTVSIVTYVDYQCPYCEQFETANESQIGQWVKAGVATLEVHPIAILDNSSLGNKYSTRAANATACVANYDSNNFYAVNTALFANQPAESTPGMSDKQLISILKGAGSSSSTISSCITSQQFKGWVKAATDRVVNGKFSGVANPAVAFKGTPSVFVNGAQYPGALTDAAAFASFVETQATAAG